jgi:hypothetical protein
VRQWFDLAQDPNLDSLQMTALAQFGIVRKSGFSFCFLPMSSISMALATLTRLARP